MIRPYTRFDNSSHACQKEDDFFWDVNRGEESLKIAEAPHDFNNKETFDFTKKVHVVINLNAPDEQIKNDFNYWLSNFRKAVNFETEKKNFFANSFSILD